MIQKIRKLIPWLLPTVALVLIAGLLLSRVIRPDSSPPEPEIQIHAAEAELHIGTAAKVCGQVASAEYRSDIGGQPTFLNFEQPHPNQVFTAVIWGENRRQWRVPPEDAYMNRDICVTGWIEEHRGTPQIVIELTSQIRLQNP